MIEDVLSVEQVAQALGLHPKTVRGFITDGKLKARKIGKGWRIMKRDLESFIGSRDGSSAESIESSGQAGQTETGRDPGGVRMRVSTIIDLFVANRDEADRLSTAILAAASSKDPALGDVRIDYIYYENESKARFVLYGSALFIGELLIMLTKIS